MEAVRCVHPSSERCVYSAATCGHHTENASPELINWLKKAKIMIATYLQYQEHNTSIKLVAGRQIDRQTERLTDRQTDRPKDIPTLQLIELLSQLKVLNDLLHYGNGHLLFHHCK